MVENDNDKPPAYEDEENETGFFRWMSSVVVLLAVAGFFGLAWYAYKNGGEPVDEKDVEIVHASKTPVKEAPANPGGMQIQNQDKTVYGLINGNKTEKPTVERILPPAEEPIKRGGDTETWMSDKAKSKIDGDDAAKNATAAPVIPVEDITEKKTEQFNPAKIRAAEDSTAPEKENLMKPADAEVQMADATPPATAQKTPEPAPATAAVTAVAPVTTPTPASPAPTTPAPVTPPSAPPAAPVAAAAPEPETTPAATPVTETEDTSEPAPAPAPKKPAAAKTASGPRVQLGAYKSEAEAKADWAKISKIFSDNVSDKEHYIVRVDLGDKGVFYRLQVGPFASSKTAEHYCLDFVSAGRACFLAKRKQ